MELIPLAGHARVICVHNELCGGFELLMLELGCCLCCPLSSFSYLYILILGQMWAQLEKMCIYQSWVEHFSFLKVHEADSLLIT